MFKKFFSLFMVFLLMPIASAVQDTTKESSELVPNGWVPSLEQAEASWRRRAKGMADLRTQCFKGEMVRDNWDLSQLHIDANGVDVFGE